MFNCVCLCGETSAAVVSDDRPVRPSRSPTVHPARHSEANLLKCVSCNFSALLGYLCIFPFRQPFPECHRGFVQQSTGASVNSSRAFVVMGFKAEDFCYCVFSPPLPKAADAHRERQARGVAAVRKTFLSKMLDLRPRHSKT